MKVTVPTGWEGVTLREYQAYHALMTEGQEKLKDSTNPDLTDFELKCAIISLFSGADMDEILTLQRFRVEDIMNYLRFLSAPIVGKVSNRVKVNGKGYYFEKRSKKISGGQWITLQHFLQDPDRIDFNLHNLLACFAYRTKWKYWTQKYDGKNHERTAEDMKDLPMTFVKPLTDFFLSDWENSVKSTLHFLEMLAKRLKRQAEKELKRSSQNMDGSMPWTISQTGDLNYGTITST